MLAVIIRGLEEGKFVFCGAAWRDLCLSLRYLVSSRAFHGSRCGSPCSQHFTLPVAFAVVGAFGIPGGLSNFSLAAGGVPASLEG